MVAAAYARANESAVEAAAAPVVVTEEVQGKVVALLASAGMSTDNVDDALGELMTLAPDTYADMLHWYNSSGYTAAGTRADTAMGKIFLGLVQKLLPRANRLTGTVAASDTVGITNDPNFDAFYRAAKAVEGITGIAAWKILQAVDIHANFATQGDAQAAIASSLKTLFATGQYTSMFEASPAVNPAGEVLGVHPDKPASTSASYTDTDDHIRIRFDFADPTLQYDHGNVYLIDAMGNELGGASSALITGDMRNTLYVDIPMDRVRALFPGDGVVFGTGSTIFYVALPNGDIGKRGFENLELALHSIRPVQ